MHDKLHHHGYKYIFVLARSSLLLVFTFSATSLPSNAANPVTPAQASTQLCNTVHTPHPQERLPARFSLYWDSKFSTLTGASLASDALEIYSLLWPHRGYLFSSWPPNESSDNVIKQIGWGVERMAHLYIDFYASMLTCITNHEVFGHGFRLREIGGLNPRYTLFYAVPGDAEKLMELKRSLPPKEFTQKEIGVHIGGIESSQVLTKQVTLHCLCEQRITPTQAWLFLQGTLDGIVYVRHAYDENRRMKKPAILKDVVMLARAINYPDQASPSAFNAAGEPLNLRTLHAAGYLNDVRNYIAKINELYDDPKALDIQQVQSAYRLNYLDPFVGYALYYLAFEYLIKGNVHWKYPMIPIGEIRYLPGLKCIMTPYGLETQLVNYLRYRHMSAQVFINYGQHYAHTSYSIGGQCNAIPVNDHLSLGGRLYVWKQPQLLTDAPADALSKLGIMTTVIGEYAFNQYFGLVSHVGYKTQGYLQGECLASSFIFRLGVKLCI